MEWFEKIATRVRSPRGGKDEKEVAYQQLCERLGLQPLPEQPAVRHSVWRRVAASVVLVAMVGLGVAGLYQVVTTAEPEQVSQSQRTDETKRKAEPLEFRQQPLSVIAATLTNRYGKKVTVRDSVLAQYRMTATFGPDETLPEILSALATAGHFHFCSTEQGYELFP